MGGAKKKIKKIIPKEIAPAAPFIASALVGPAFAGSNFLTSRIANEAVRNAVAKGIVSAATETAQGGKGKDILRAGVLAAAPDAISAGVNKAAAGTGDFAKFLNKSKTLKDGTQTMTLAERAAAIANPETLGGKVKLAGAQTALNVAPKIAEMNEKALRDYEAQLREQGSRS